MLPEETLTKHQFFRFSVPSLPDLSFVLPGKQIATISELLPIMQVPLLPPSVLGIAQWVDINVSVLDLALLLTDTAPDSEGSITAENLLIVRNDTDYLAWAILPGAYFLDLPSQIPAGTDNALTSSPLIYATGQFDGKTIFLLDLNGILSVFNPMSQ